MTDRLAATRFGEICRFDRIDSTNAYVLGEAAAGAAEGLVVVAAEQTAGRGRLGRTWVAPAGSSLLVSVLLRPRLAAEQRPLLLGAGALAASDAVRALTRVEARVKWPNDVVVGDRKLAGLLAEAIGDAVVVGFGCNVAWPAFPDDIAETATSLDREVHGATVPGVDELLVEWLWRYDREIARLERGDAVGVVADLRARMSTLGRRVRVDVPGESFDGVAEGLTVDGHLAVRLGDGRVREVAAADVVHLRPA